MATITDKDILKRQMLKGLSAAAVYRIHVQIGTEAHYSIKSIEITREIYKIAAIFRKNRIQFSNSHFLEINSQKRKCDCWTPLIKITDKLLCLLLLLFCV